MARLHDILHKRHGRSVGGAQEVRRTDWRGRFQEGARGCWALQICVIRPGIELTLEAFDQYWRKTPSVKRIVFRAIPDEATRLVALKRGEVDIAYLLRGELAEELERTKGLISKAICHRCATLALLLRSMGRKIALA